MRVTLRYVPAMFHAREGEDIFLLSDRAQEGRGYSDHARGIIDFKN